MLAAARKIGRPGLVLRLSPRVPLRSSCLRLNSIRSISGVWSNAAQHEKAVDGKVWTDATKDLSSQELSSTSVSKSVDDSGKQEDEVVPGASWNIIHRPILETLLKSYANHPTVAQPLLLHGPRGVGKRTIIEGLVGTWNKSPHISAYIDLHTEQRQIPPWTVYPKLQGYEEDFGISFLDDKAAASNCGNFGLIRSQLEEGLELLARNAIEMGYADSDHILEALLERHAIEGALSQFLRGRGGSTKSTAEKWKEAIRLARFVDDVPTELSSDALNLPINSALSQKSRLQPQTRRQASVSKANSKEESLASLLVAKQLIKIQDGWRVPSGAQCKSQGVTNRASADAATSYAIFLLQLLSFAVQEGHFQPKLVINNLDLLRKAVVVSPGESVDGALYHDSLLMQITRMGVSCGCIPIICVSSDSYYSCKIFSDHGDDLAFISQEVLGWTPQEAAIHLVPALFEESEWKMIVGILGPTARHVAELHSIWHHPSFLQILENTSESPMGECIDLYLGYLQVTAVDPAMDAAIKILVKFAQDCTSGKISKRILRHGAAWRHPARAPDMHIQWAKLQLLDYIQAFAETDFGVNHQDVKAQDLLEDPATDALLQVGLLYQQRDLPYLRPITRGVSRCLVRWHVREMMKLSSIESLKYSWHRLIRGRFYKHLVVV